MKRVLIISYYWPPAGGGGVQRWLKMTKYLHEAGWQPIIYTPSNAEVAGMDSSLAREIHPSVVVIQSPIWEPYDIYKKVLGIKKEEKIYSGFIQKDSKKPQWLRTFTQWIRGNFFIPDARKFWKKPGITFLNNYISDHKIDAIISTGPPHTTHLIAMSVAKTNKIPWVADFRDPWTQIDFYKDLHLSYFADKKHKALEKKVLIEATKVVTISPTLVQDLQKISKRSDIQYISNGYDPADFVSDIEQRTDKFVLSHVGSMNGDRNPDSFWQAISKTMVDVPSFAEDLELALIGPVDSKVFESIEKAHLTQNLRHISFVPHDEAIAEMRSAHLLFLSINNTENQGGILTGKLFEYLGAKRPILCIGPEKCDAVDLLREFQPDSLASFENVDRVVQIIKKHYADFKNKNIPEISNDVEKFSRRSLAHAFAKLLDEIT
jgi:glycosyltransferase involved in cell wall biosynthesis